MIWIALWIAVIILTCLFFAANDEGNDMNELTNTLKYLSTVYRNKGEDAVFKYLVEYAGYKDNVFCPDGADAWALKFFETYEGEIKGLFLIEGRGYGSSENEI